MNATTWVRAGVVFAAIAAGGFGGAGVALADPPPSGGTEPTEGAAAQRIVRRAALEFRRVAHEACEDLNRAALRGVARVRGLDRSGAADAEIVAAGAAATARLVARADGATTRIGEIQTRALAALASNAGTQEQIDRVNAAAQAAVDRVNACEARASARIAAAVTAATGPG